MAFRQSTIAPPRQTLYREAEHTLPAPQPVVEQRLEPPGESQEWLLFPVQSRSSIQTYTASTARTPKTNGLSRLSEFGSFGTVARSEEDTHSRQGGEEGGLDEDEELDSLDDGLHAFQESSLFHEGRHCDQSESILPRHDGLGMFTGSTVPIQEQLWQFEQYNPMNKAVSAHHRRRSSVQRILDAVEDNDDTNIQRERNKRIERWRLDQSRVLMQEVERQTRRRLSRVKQQRDSISHQSASTKNSDSGKAFLPSNLGKEDSTTTPSSDLVQHESIWQHITRRIIRDFIGMDETILAIILGEALASEPVKPSVGLSSASTTEISLVPKLDVKWEKRILDRLSRELGVLVQHLTNHPGAFSTPSIPPPLEYAGIPIRPQSTPKPPPFLHSHRSHPTTSPSTPHFAPTLQNQNQYHPLTPTTSASDSHHAALWGIEEETSEDAPPPTSPQADLEYWERPPTLTTIFRLLHHRFVASRPSSPHQKPPKKNIATTSTADSLRRAAIIRQHHPLVSRAHAAAARSRRGCGTYGGFSYGEKRRGDGDIDGSCASSAKRRRSGSSRHYWDIGASVGGSESAGGGSFGMGAWGEV